MMKKTCFYLIALGLIIISCSQENNEETITANSTFKVENFEVLSGNWELLSVTTSEEAELIPPDEVNIVFSEKENESNIDFLIDGKSTCNQYGGELIALGDKTIEFEQLYSTEMLCEDNILNDFEIQYFSWLFGTTEYLLEGDNLFLKGEVNLKFAKISR